MNGNEANSAGETKCAEAPKQNPRVMVGSHFTYNRTRMMPIWLHLVFVVAAIALPVVCSLIPGLSAVLCNLDTEMSVNGLAYGAIHKQAWPLVAFSTMLILSVIALAWIERKCAVRLEKIASDERKQCRDLCFRFFEKIERVDIIPLLVTSTSEGGNYSFQVFLPNANKEETRNSDNGDTLSEKSNPPDSPKTKGSAQPLTSPNKDLSKGDFNALGRPNAGDFPKVIEQVLHTESRLSSIVAIKRQSTSNASSTPLHD